MPTNDNHSGISQEQEQAPEGNRSRGKFTRSRIAELLRSEAGLKDSQAREMAGRIIGALAAALAAGEAVELRGLGAFAVRERKAYTAHNPRTLAPVDVPARRVVCFKPGRELQAALRSGGKRRLEKQARIFMS